MSITQGFILICKTSYKEGYIIPAIYTRKPGLKFRIFFFENASLNISYTSYFFPTEKAASEYQQYLIRASC